MAKGSHAVARCHPTAWKQVGNIVQNRGELEKHKVILRSAFLSCSSCCCGDDDDDDDDDDHDDDGDDDDDDDDHDDDGDDDDDDDDDDGDDHDDDDDDDDDGKDDDAHDHDLDLDDDDVHVDHLKVFCWVPKMDMLYLIDFDCDGHATAWGRPFAYPGSVPTPPCTTPPSTPWHRQRPCAASKCLGPSTSRDSWSNCEKGDQRTIGPSDGKGKRNEMDSTNWKIRR